MNNMKKVLKNNLISVIIFLGVISLGAVIAANVVVENGDLDVDEDLSVTGDLIVDTNTLYVDETNSKVGVGLTDPLKKFHIYSPINSEARMYIEADSGDAGPGLELAFDRTSTRRGLIRLDEVGSTGTELSFWTVEDGGSIAQNMVLADEGSLGIGTTTPDAKLQVIGDVKIGEDGSNRIELSHDGTDGVITTAAGDLKLSATGDILLDKDVEFSSDAGLAYGEIYALDSGTTITITTQATKVQIDAFESNGESNGMTPDYTNGHITVLDAGKYLVTLSLTLESVGGGGADEFSVDVKANNGDDGFPNLHAHRALLGGGGDIGSVSINGIVDLEASDTVEVWIHNEDSTDNVIVDDITLSLVQVGG